MTDKIELSGIELAGINQGQGKTSWVLSLPLDTPVWNGKKLIAFSKENLIELQSEFIKINHEFTTLANESKASAYRFPVKVNHNRGSGESFGELVDVKVVTDKKGVVPGLYLSVKWNDKTWDDIQASNYKYVSVGIWPEYTTQLGNSFGPVIVELSLTEYPRVQNIGKIQDTLELELSNDLGIEETNMNMEQIKALVEAMIDEKIAMLKEEMKQEEVVEEQMEEVTDEEPVTEEAPEDTQVETMAEDAVEVQEEVVETPVEEVVPEVKPTDEEELAGAGKKKVKLSNEDVIEKLNALENKLNKFFERSEYSVNLNFTEKGKTGEAKTVKPSYNELLDKFIAEGMSVAAASVKAMKMTK